MPLGNSKTVPKINLKMSLYSQLYVLWHKILININKLKITNNMSLRYRFKRKFSNIFFE